MRKIISLISLFTIVLFTLAGCGHTHEFADATCTAAKTCTECGETEGEPLGHNWKEADCENPKTCTRCGETEGKAISHKWEKADCEHPAKCTVCGLTSGNPRGHDLVVGVCKQCGEFVNGDVALQKLDDLLDVNKDYVEPANTLISSANTSSLQDMYDKFTQAQSYLDNAYQQWQYTVDILDDFNNDGSRSDFISVFSDICILMETVPSGVNGSNYQDLIDYLVEYKQFLENYQRFCQDAANFAKEMSYH